LRIAPSRISRPDNRCVVEHPGFHRPSRHSPSPLTILSVERDLHTEPVTSLDLSAYVAVSAETPVREALAAMGERNQNCALITGADGRLAGILTERDVIHRVVTVPETLAAPVETVMTRNPDTLPPDGRVRDALHFMNRHHYRNVPVVDEAGRIVGNLTDYAIIRFIGSRLPDKVYNRPPEDQFPDAPEGA
jgi:CBS domain-containing protein